MWKADPMEGEVGELPPYAPAFKEVYRFILEAMDGDVLAATGMFEQYLAGEMPERLLSISRHCVKAEQAGAGGPSASPIALAA
jgi:hypothetical protein